MACKVHGVTGGQVEIGCDGLSALQQSFHPDNIPNAPTAPQFDLICAIRRVAKQCPVVWLPRHVGGHQDNDLMAILDRHALLNIEMDTGAKALMFSLPQTLGSDQVQYKIFGEPWSIWLGSKKLSKDFRSAIQDIRHGIPLSVLGVQGTLWISLSKHHRLASKPDGDQNLDCVPASLAHETCFGSLRDRKNDGPLETARVGCVPSMQ